MRRTTRPLSWAHRRRLAVLSGPAFGIAAAYTVVTTYVPTMLNEISGPLVTGVLIGAEGLLALLIPLLVAGASSRYPVIVGGSAVAAGSMVLLPLTSRSLLLVAVLLTVFFAAYFVCFTPYSALFPELVDRDEIGRSQGVQGALRSLGLLLAMSGGGLLLDLWQPLPFVTTAALLLVSVWTLGLAIRTEVPRPSAHAGGFAATRDLLRRDRRIRWWALANACWEAAIGALRSFVVLYFTAGLGLSLISTAAALGLVGIAAVIAAPFSGLLADRYGVLIVMRVAVWVFAIGLLPTLLTTNHLFIAAIVPVAFAAVVLLTLPYALFLTLDESGDEYGTGAGIFTASRGIGILAGPAAAGIATDLAGGLFPATKGYAAVFAVTIVFLLASVPLLRRIATDSAEPAL